MDAPINYSLTLDGFDFEITKTDEGLFIQADHKKSAQLFTKVLTPESIKTISQDPFFDLSTTYQVMKDYFEEKPEAALLSLTPEGKLTYACKLYIGKVAKESGFEIQLEKKELEPLVRLERAFGKLSDRVTDIEKRGNNNGLDQDAQDKKMMTFFADFEKRLFERLTGIEKRLTKVEEHIQKTETLGPGIENMEPGFDVKSSFAQHFTFSNNNKTLTATPNSNFKHIFTNKPLVKSKISKLSFRVEKTQKLLGFGMALSEVLNHQGYPFENSKSYMFFGSGNIWKDGKSTLQSIPAPSNGDIVTFLINTTTGEFTVDVNGKVIDKHKFKAENLQSTDFYGFVYVQSPTESVTLL